MKYLGIIVASLLATNVAHADLDQAMNEMCSKMKSCSTEEIKRQGLPEEMISAMSTMFDGMCKSWMNPYANAVGQAGLEKKAEACIDSVVSASCEEIMQSEGEFKTEECDEFEKAAEESGVDLENVSE